MSGSTQWAVAENYQELIDLVRRCVASPASFQAEDMTVIAQQFRELTKAVEARARQCLMLLQQGHRSEALRIATMEPPLLDVVVALDFPELESWQLLCESMDLPTPAPVPENALAQLEEAFTAERSVEHLLRQFRAQAIARAPLADRLQTLRLLVQRDPANLQWIDDLTQHEAAFLREIRDKLPQLLKEEKLNEISKYRKLLSQPSWQTPPPESLKQAVEKAYLTLRAQLARKELQELLPKIDEAYAAQELTQLRDLYERWTGLADVAQLKPDEPLALKVQPAFEWLNEEQKRQLNELQFQETVRRLEHAIDSRKPLEDVERLYTLALRYGYELPDTLERRYQTYCEQLRAAQLVRARIFYGAVVVIVLALLAASVVLGKIFIDNKRVHQIATAIDDLLKKDQCEKAEQYFNEFAKKYPTLANRPEAEEARRKIELALAQEKERKQKFDRLVNHVKQSLQAVPDEEALRQLEKIARLQDEKTKVGQLRQQVAARKRQLEQDRQERITAQLREIDAQIDELSGASLSEEEKEVRATQVRSKLLSMLSGDLPALRRPEVEARLRRLDSLLEQIRRRKQLQEKLRYVIAAVGDQESYIQRLRAFADEFPTDPNSAGFRYCAQQPRMFEALDAWNKLAADWNNATPAIDAQQAASLLDAVRQQKSWLDVLAPASYDKLTAFLEPRAQPPVDLTTDMESLASFWNDPLIADVWLIEFDDGRRYYTLSRLDQIYDGMTVEVVQDTTLKIRRITLVKDKVKYAGPAPQAIMASKVLAFLDEAPTTPSQNDKFFQELLNLVLIDSTKIEPPIDPLLMCLLMDNTLSLAIKVDPDLKGALSDILRELATFRADADTWLASNNPTADNRRKQAEQLLQEIRKRYQEYREQANRDEKPLINLPILRWVGLVVDLDNLYTAASPHDFTEAEEGKKVYTLVPRKDVVVPKLVGTIKEGNISLLDSAHDWLQPGRPLVIAVGP